MRANYLASKMRAVYAKPYIAMNNLFRWFLLGSGFSATAQLGLLPLSILAFSPSWDNLLLGTLGALVLSPLFGVALVLVIMGVRWLHEWKMLQAEIVNQLENNKEVRQVAQLNLALNEEKQKTEVWQEALQNKEFAQGIITLIDQIEKKRQSGNPTET